MSRGDSNIGLPRLQQLARLRGTFEWYKGNDVLIVETRNTGHSIEYMYMLNGTVEMNEAGAKEWLGALL